MAVNQLFTKSFFQRTVSGIVLVLIALLTIISGGIVLNATLTIVSLIGLTELYRIYKIRMTGEAKTIYFAGCIATVVWYILLGFDKTQYFDILLIVFLLVLMSLYVFLFPKIATRQVMAGVFGFLYVCVMLSYIYRIRMAENGAYTVWLVFLCSWGSDTCAYLAGVTMGKHKMAPVLSPKKSIEGFVGGIVGAALLGWIYATVFHSEISMAMNPQIVFPVICAVGSMISVIGDLAASAIKRKHDIKDYGHLIPGHGGILDRFDSVIFTAPLIWFLILLFHWIAK